MAKYIIEAEGREPYRKYHVVMIERGSRVYLRTFHVRAEAEAEIADCKYRDQRGPVTTDAVSERRERRYYAKSGTFANAITVCAFPTRQARDAWVADEPRDGTSNHFEHNREPITLRVAEEQLARNNRMRRDYRKYGAPYDECYGTTGTMAEIEVVE